LASPAGHDKPRRVAWLLLCEAQSARREPAARDALAA